uniref:Lipoprotein n=1 Tax=mine drainage metagenome TaxID=410659 RepID=E6QIS8_9ZZZZ
MQLRNLPVLALMLCAFALLCAGCKNYQSYWVNVTVSNQTGALLRDVEIDYPSASFGINTLAANAIYHYRLKINGSGKIHAQYAAPMGRTIRVDGPILQENQQGNISIQLLPDHKILFSDQLSMGHGDKFSVH